MKKVLLYILTIFAITMSSTCVCDPTRDIIHCQVIDFDTKKTIAGAIVGIAKYTNDSGYFRTMAHGNKGYIGVTKDGYKPFSLKIDLKLNNKEFKTYTLCKENSKNELTDDLYNEENSSSFRVINGDSLIIELKKK